MIIKPMSDEEINKLIEDQKFDIKQTIEFNIANIEQKFSANNNNPMLQVSLQITCKPEWYPVRDWMLYESNAGLHKLKFKRFMQSIGLQEMYESGEISPSDILSQAISGKFRLREEDNEYTDKKTGNLVKGKKYVVDEYIINPVQKKDLDYEKGFNDNIPF
jgi:hypothetical protein